MTDQERTRVVLVLLIMGSCGLLSLIVRGLEHAEAATESVQEALPHTAIPTSVPTATPTIMLSALISPIQTAAPMATTEPTNTPTLASSPVPTNTPANPATPPSTTHPTATPTPTETLLPTDTPQPPATPMPTVTEMPEPTGTFRPILPLTMDWVLVEKHCISETEWFLEFWLTASGGTGEYTFYRDIERLHGPAPADGFGYQMYAGTASAAVGTFAVESGTQRVESKFWVKRLDCGHLAPPPTPSSPPTPSASGATSAWVSDRTP